MVLIVVVLLRSGPQGRTGTRAASLLQSASNQLLQQQGILVHAQLSLPQEYLMMLLLCFLWQCGGSSHSPT